MGLQMLSNLNLKLNPTSAKKDNYQNLVNITFIASLKNGIPIKIGAAVTAIVIIPLI
jgi:hypothetical protein